MSVRPFSFSESFNFPRPPGSEWGGSSQDFSVSRTRESAETVPAQSYDIQLSSCTDPFADTAEERSVLDEYKLIHRQYVPNMSDELAVAVGERVKLLQAYDGGWVLVEKVTNDLAKGASSCVRGLIPVHCIQPKQEDSSEFLAARRKSSHVYRR
ncbi:hypothetical protein NEOLEDRAFT_1059448 [Neolentinus lepideus HHB14362 ss-1]|uniref:SH3 domain-containing protein n=1 Tax=Neolentinus lepideus HHB14362 ss-1 TaxID=1314782 RepID=A0A165UHG6_9AGAM|nr:hypothetical protein NEOLEDRAFT_1059448 [Neolentinus lepideus HHB14362 ss-1]